MAKKSAPSAKPDSRPPLLLAAHFFDLWHELLFHLRRWCACSWPQPRRRSLALPTQQHSGERTNQQQVLRQEEGIGGKRIHATHLLVHGLLVLPDLWNHILQRHPAVRLELWMLRAPQVDLCVVVSIEVQLRPGLTTRMDHMSRCAWIP